MGKSGSALAMMAMMGLAVGSCGHSIFPPRCRSSQMWKKARKCALPGCENETTRGYCCAEHCKEHKIMLRAERKGEVE